MTGFAIRPYRDADAQACACIFDRAWHAGHPYAPREIGLETFRQEMTNRAGLVAEAHDGRVLGFAGIHLPASFIHHLYVDPDVQGRGIGRALLQRALEVAGGRATLKCQTRNPRALAFYRRAGWTTGEEGTTDLGPWVRLHSPEPGAAKQPEPTT